VWLVAAACGRVDFDAQSATDARVSADGPGPRACTAPIGHDEDADATDDSCDVCPHLADDQADADGDGVGDACDPEPSVPRQRIALFDPFTGIADGWSTEGNVAFDGERLILSAAGTAAAYSRPLPPGDDLFITHATYTGFGGPAYHAAVEVEETGTRVFYCEVYGDDGSSRMMLTYTLDGVSFLHDANQPLAESAFPGSGTIAFRTSPSATRCDVTWNGQSLGGDGSWHGITPVSFVLEGISVDVTFDYVLQIHTE
jgi:hypothetical protein